MKEVIYQLTTEDVQGVAMELLNRKLSQTEIKKIIESIEEKLAWHDAIADSINEAFQNEVCEIEFDR
jgi:hypothetical protein